MVYLVSYDLKGYRPASVYHQLGEEVKSISGTWMHLGESRWLVETQLSTNEVAARLAPLTIAGDQIFVSRIYRDWSGYSLTPQEIAWLNGRNFMSWWDALAMLPLPMPIKAATSSATALAAAIRGAVQAR